jgi:hypothetical protein
MAFAATSAAIENLIAIGVVKQIRIVGGIKEPAT